MKIWKWIPLMIAAVLLLALPAMAEKAFEEIVLADDENVTVKITGIEPEGMWGYTMNVYLENRTDDALMFMLQSACVNGYITDPIWAMPLNPGESLDDAISFSSLEEDGVTGDITEIRLDFEVSDYMDFTAEPLLSELFVIYPMGETAATVVEREPLTGDVVMFDDGNVSMTVTGFYYDDIWGYIAQVYLVNRTDTNLMFSVDNAKVNGMALDPFWAFSVMSDARAYSEIVWSVESLAAYEIKNVREIELEITVGDADDWAVPDLLEGTYTIVPSTE